MPFAAVCCCFLRCVAACTFCYLSSPKMVPKCSPEASKHLQNRPKIAPWRTLGPPGGTKILFFRFGIDFGAQFGPPWDPKSTKNRYLARKIVKKARFQSNVCLARCITSFFMPLKRWKKHHVVVLLAGISYPWKTMYFTGYPAWGQCFCKYAEILKI